MVLLSKSEEKVFKIIEEIAQKSTTKRLSLALVISIVAWIITFLAGAAAHGYNLSLTRI